MIDRRRLIGLAAALVAYPALAAEPPAQPFDQQAFDAALAEGRPVLVEISAPWCPVCKTQKEILADLLAEARFARMLLLEVDFDSRKDVVRALGAQAQSTLIVYAGGAEVGRSVGDTNPESVEALLAQAL
jgi:thioredoxin-like negative regulator of GroEL